MPGKRVLTWRREFAKVFLSPVVREVIDPVLNFLCQLFESDFVEAFTDPPWFRSQLRISRSKRRPGSADGRGIDSLPCRDRYRLWRTNGTGGYYFAGSDDILFIPLLYLILIFRLVLFNEVFSAYGYQTVLFPLASGSRSHQMT